MTKEQIEQMQEQIESVVGAIVDDRDHLAVSDKINQISTLLSSGSVCIAHSKKLELTARGKWLRQHMEKIASMKPSVAKEYVDTACIDEQILVVRCEKNYSALVHCGDFLRSILSMIKAYTYQINAA